jgi:tetratricopeptide (TPR) repeat protein
MATTPRLHAVGHRLAQFDALSPRAVCLAVAGLAVAVRLLYFASSSGAVWDQPILDADTNLQLARAMLRGTAQEPYWQPPGFAWILSLILRVSDALLLPRLLMAAMSCASAAAVTSIMLHLKARNRTAALAGALVALNAALLYYDGDFLPPSLATFLVTAALWSLVAMKTHWRRSLLIGALVGAATVTVATLGLLLPVLCLHPYAHRVYGPRGSKHMLLCVFAALAMMAPALAHNVSAGAGLSIARSGGINLWIGNNPHMNELVALRPGSGWESVANEPERALGRRPSPQEYDQYFLQKTKQFCLSQPGLCLRNVLDRVRQLSNSRELPRNESLWLARKQSPVLAVLYNGVGTFWFPWGTLFALGAVGLVFGLDKSLQNSSAIADESTRTNTKRPASESANVTAAVANDTHRAAWSCLRWTTLALALGPLLFFVTGRYRVPMIPVMAMAAAWGAETLWHKRRSLRVLAVFLLAIALTSWPMKLPVDRVRFDAEMHYLIAGAQLQRGDAHSAEQSLKRALRANPRYLEAGLNLGLLLIRQHRLAEAFGILDAVVRFNPANIQAKMTFAAVAMDTESFVDAATQYQAVLQAEPNNVAAMSGLCVVALRQQRLADARMWHARAIAVQPPDGLSQSDPPPGWRFCDRSLHEASP